MTLYVYKNTYICIFAFWHMRYFRDYMIRRLPSGLMSSCPSLAALKMPCIRFVLSAKGYFIATFAEWDWSDWWAIVKLGRQEMQEHVSSLQGTNEKSKKTFCSIYLCCEHFQIHSLCNSVFDWHISPSMWSRSASLFLRCLSLQEQASRCQASHDMDVVSESDMFAESVLQSTS